MSEKRPGWDLPPRLPQDPGRVCQKADWQIHVFRLKANYYHLVLEPPNANLVVGMGLVAERMHHPA